jgi:hypothetical protein
MTKIIFDISDGNASLETSFQMRSDLEPRLLEREHVYRKATRRLHRRLTLSRHYLYRRHQQSLRPHSRTQAAPLPRLLCRLRLQQTRLVRKPPHNARSHLPRNPDQNVETQLKNRTHRRLQSRLAGPTRNHRIPPLHLGKAGFQITCKKRAFGITMLRPPSFHASRAFALAEASQTAHGRQRETVLNVSIRSVP